MSEIGIELIKVQKSRKLCKVKSVNIIMSVNWHLHVFG